MKFNITSFWLHIIAIILMTIDHIVIVFIGNENILRAIGRPAFPIFAFLLAEGFYKTKNRKNYFVRLLILAIVSEPIFDYVLHQKIPYWFQQNVIFTFLLAFCAMTLIEKINKDRVKTTIIFFASMIVGFLTMIDYNYIGIPMVLTFYLFKEKTKLNLIAQISIITILSLLLGGQTLFTIEQIKIPDEILSLLALIPIWLYTGKQGLYNKWVKYFYYAFYPTHLAIIYLVSSFF